MPAPAEAFVIRNALVKIGASSFQSQVTKARLVPDAPVSTLRTVVPDGVAQDVDTATWVLELSGVQDFTNTTGIADAIMDAYTAGTDLTIEVAPKNVTGKTKATVTAKAVPVPFGEEQGKWNLFEITLPVVGQPTFGTVP